jgi:hypothetical protein
MSTTLPAPADRPAATAVPIARNIHTELVTSADELVPLSPSNPPAVEGPPVCGRRPRRGTRSSGRRRWHAIALATGLAFVAALLPLSTPPAQAAQGYSGWLFQTDIICDQTTGDISIQSTAVSDYMHTAHVGYRYWVSYNNNEWSGPSNWRMFYYRDGYWEMPQVLFRGSGTYQIYVQYAISTQGGSWLYLEEYASHRYSMGGFTGSNSTPVYSSCSI